MMSFPLASDDAIKIIILQMKSFPKHYFGAVEGIPKRRRQEVLKNVKTRKQNYARDMDFDELISQPKIYRMKKKVSFRGGPESTMLQ